MPNRNTIDFTERFRDFRDPELKFQVSTRALKPEMSLLDYLKIFYMYLDFPQIESVFGNCVYPSKLYGGRSYKKERSRSVDHIKELAETHISLSLTLTNHFFDLETYRENLEFLERHYTPGNSIICTSDQLARSLRRDFPNYRLKASLIKHLNTVEKVSNALNFYDFVVIPMDKNDDDHFLAKLPEKQRIILFANADCAYSCPSRNCYTGFSQFNRKRKVTAVCSKERIPRLGEGRVFFDVKKLSSMGFRHFKLIPQATPEKVETLRALGKAEKGCEV